MNNLENIKIRLKNDLPREGISQVLKSIKGLLPETAAKYNTLIQIESTYKELKLKIMDGIIKEDAIKQANAEIRDRLLTLIDSLESADFDKKTKKSNLSKDQKIRKGHVLYKIPQQMQLWQEARCLVRIAFEKAMLIEDLDIDENTQFRMDVRVSDYMKVEVVDPAPSPVFEIRSTSEPVQIIDQDDFTEWKFYIKPLQAGEHLLELKVTIMINIDGEIRVREKTLEESVVIVSEETEVEAPISFKRDSEAFVLPCAADTLTPTSGYRLPKALRPMAMALLFLMIGSTATYAFTPPIQRDWLRTHYIDGKLLGDATAYDDFIKKYEDKPAAKSQQLVERATFEKAVVKETPEAFEEYIEKYSDDGVYAEQATWQVATLSKQPEAYLDYMEKYPHKLERVKTAVKELKVLETKVWEEVQSKQDAESIGRYLKLYADRDGQYIKAAKEKLQDDTIWEKTVVPSNEEDNMQTTAERQSVGEQYLWESVIIQNDKKAYQSYLRKYKDEGRYTSIAKDSLSRIVLREKQAADMVKAQRLWKGILQKPSKAAYQNYLKQFPNSEKSSIASAMLDSIKTVERLNRIAEERLRATANSRQPIPVSPATTSSKGTFTDPDDQQVYPYIKIGNQIWMTRNMNKNIEDSWYHADLKSELDRQKYGRLYTWQAAKKVCPKGWHLPTDEEWKTLLNNMGGYDDLWGDGEVGNAKKSYQNLIQGGSSNFAALLGGERFGDGEFIFLSGSGGYWSATEQGAVDAWYYSFGSGNGRVSRYYDNKASGLSCRCLED